MFSCFCQQDSQINVDRGWLEDTCKNVIALPFSKLQFALSWITPRNDVVVHNNGDFYSAENLALSRGSRSFQKVVDQSSPRCLICLTVTVTSKSISLCGFRPPSTAEPYKCTASNVGSRWRSMTPTTSVSRVDTLAITAALMMLYAWHSGSATWLGLWYTRRDGFASP